MTKNNEKTNEPDELHQLGSSDLTSTPKTNNLLFRIDTEIMSESIVEFRLKSEFYGIQTDISKGIMNLQDRAIRAALHKLGWIEKKKTT